MASAPIQTTQAPKPSFATVAAPAYVPQNTNHTIVSTSMQNPSDSATTQMPGTDGADDAVNVPMQPAAADNADVDIQSPQDGNRLRILKNDHRREREYPDQRPSPGVLRQLATEDSSTQVSSSNSSGKPTSGDADEKSTTSGTTFALDEKESLRPDDSASLRCNNDEEEAFSAAGSVVAGSRVGSDSGARAFRDQLREISGMGSAPQHPTQPETFSQPPIANGNLVFTGSPLCAPEPQNPVLHPVSTALVGEKIESPPDEKLLEALESPRDRVFVLKLEQDTIDFIKDTKEDKLELPQCNAFYRMLAHKLADYYMLGHLVDPTGTAVVFHRTPYCRIPTLLSGWPTRAVAATTPPPTLTARKIMRRGDDTKVTSGSNTTANSEGPSKTTSEVGGDSGSDVNDPKSKAAMSREEREAKYREARQRIFGDATETSTPGTPNETEEKDVSRSSSTSGKKKSKKPRNYNDDGFEPRSQISTYYTPQYPTTAIAPENMYYNMYPGVVNAQQFPLMPQNGPAPMQYSNGYPPVMQPGPQPQFQWSPQPYAVAANGFPVQGYGQPAQINYDQLTTDFQRGMQSFQTASSSPAMHTSQLGFQNQFQQQPQQTAPIWPQNPCTIGMQYPQPGYMQLPSNDGSIMPPNQNIPPTQYPYGQLPNPVYNGSKQPLQNQHPVPGSYMGRQFNPQSQSFIPGGRMGPPPSQPRPHQTPSPSMSNSGFGTVPNPAQRASPSTSHPNSMGSPRMPQTIASPAAANAQGLAHPLPQPPNPQSSIAKWGTPAHLPPKPPPPASMEPQKFHEINRTMPTHAFPSLPARLPSSGPTTLNGNATLPATSRPAIAGGIVKGSS